MIPKMTKLEIIEELFDNHFVKNPNKRGVKICDNHSECVYYDNNTQNKCAIGMCLTTKALSCIGRETFNGDVRDLDDFFSNDLDTAMKAKYRGHSLQFWYDLQNFHDTSYYWTETGLSFSGHEMLSTLKKRYAEELNS